MTDTNMKCPCEECILLAMCGNKTELKCSILLKFLNENRKNLIYPDWPNLLKHMCKVLKGAWCPVAINNDIYVVQKNRQEHDSFRR